MTQSPFEKCLQDLKALKEIEPALITDPQVLAVVRASFVSVHSPALLSSEELAAPALPAAEKPVEIFSEIVVTDESPLVGIPGFFKDEYGQEPARKNELFKAVRNRFEAVFDRSPEKKKVWTPWGKLVPENQYPTNWLRTELEKIRVTDPSHWKLCDA